MPLNFEFDFKKPDYAEVFNRRSLALKYLRENPKLLPDLKDHYREHPAQFLTDWGSLL